MVIFKPIQGHNHKKTMAFLRQVRYIFRADTITGQGLGVPHQSRKRYS